MIQIKCVNVLLLLPALGPRPAARARSLVLSFFLSIIRSLDFSPLPTNETQGRVLGLQGGAATGPVALLAGSMAGRSPQGVAAISLARGAPPKIRRTCRRCRPRRSRLTSSRSRPPPGPLVVGGGSTTAIGGGGEARCHVHEGRVLMPFRCCSSRRKDEGLVVTRDQDNSRAHVSHSKISILGCQ